MKLIHLFFNIVSLQVYTLIPMIMELTDPFFIEAWVLVLQIHHYSINDIIICGKMLTT